MHNELKNQEGSSSFALIASLVVLSLATLFVMNSNQKQSAAISESRQLTLSRNAGDNALNAISRFKALVATRKDSTGAYLPALFSTNYYNPQWQLDRNDKVNIENASLTTVRDIVIQTGATIDNVDSVVTAIFDGGKKFQDLPLSVANLKILNTNFDLPTGRIALSLDVLITTSAQSQGKTKTISTKARVPLQVPVPRTPILEASPAGQNSWTRNLTALAPGNYDFRVLGSGVVFDAKVTINGAEDKYLGGFDSNGKIKHQAISYSSVDQEIGRFSYTLGSGDGYGVAATCTYVPVDGQYTFAVNLNGPDPVNGTTLLTQVVNVQEQPVQDVASMYENYCTDECPFLGPQKAADWNDSILNEHMIGGHFGDTTSAHVRDNEATRFGLKGKKLCINFETPAKMYYDIYKKFPYDFWELGGGTNRLDYADFYTYDVPSCKRRLLFARNNCGCFADETSILLGDGKTTKLIRDLSYEDELWNPAVGRAMKIKKITRGPEKVPMLRVMASGKELKVTGKHPFPTPSGMLPAYSLQVGERILLENGEWSRIEKIESLPDEGKERIVWNVELDAPNDDLKAHQVVANGILTGDLFIQTLLELNRGQTLSANLEAQ